MSPSRLPKQNTWRFVKLLRSPCGWPDFLASLGVSVQGPVVINADNQGSIALARNPVFHDRPKHIDIQYHFARELIGAGRIFLNYVPTVEMLAGLLTKSLPVRVTCCCRKRSDCCNGLFVRLGLVFSCPHCARLAARGCVNVIIVFCCIPVSIAICARLSWHVFSPDCINSISASTYRLSFLRAVSVGLSLCSLCHVLLFTS